ADRLARAKNGARGRAVELQAVAVAESLDARRLALDEELRLARGQREIDPSRAHLARADRERDPTERRTDRRESPGGEAGVGRPRAENGDTRDRVGRAVEARIVAAEAEPEMQAA